MAIDEKEQIDQIVSHVIQHHPQVHVIARATNRHHVYELWALGCRDIIRETYDSSVRMGRSALEALGIEHPTAEEMVEAFRRADGVAMVAAAAAYDPAVPVMENEAYVSLIREIQGPAEKALGEEMDAIRARAEPDG